MPCRGRGTKEFWAALESRLSAWEPSGEVSRRAGCPPGTPRQACVEGPGRVGRIEAEPYLCAQLSPPHGARPSFSALHRGLFDEASGRRLDSCGAHTLPCRPASCEAAVPQQSRAWEAAGPSVRLLPPSPPWEPRGRRLCGSSVPAQGDR